MQRFVTVVLIVAAMSGWVALLGYLATGSWRMGWRYLRLWARIMAATAVVSAAVFLFIWPILKPP